MSALLGFLNGGQVDLAASVARITAGALIAGVWQGLLLSAIAGLVLKAVPKSTPRLRFLIWSAVFGVSVALPFVQLLSRSSGERTAVGAATAWVFDSRWSYAVAAVWVLCAAYRAGELLLQGFGLRSLWMSAVPVPEDALAGLDVPLTIAGRRVALCTSGEVDRPSVIGFFAPRILIPEWLFAKLTATELNHILLHELEHLRRRDDWVNLLQKIGLVLLPLNPALFWIDRRLSTERELACDDGVIERTNTPRAYAASLTSVAERRLDVRSRSKIGELALSATGLIQRSSELGRRIESILSRRAPVNRVFANGLAALLVAGLLGSATWLSRTPQLVSFGGADGEPQAASSLTTPAVRVGGPGQRLPAAEFQNVSFRQRVRSAAVKAKVEVRRRSAAKAVARVSERQLAGRIAISPALPRQFVVLTSWQDSPVSRVVIATPDGRFLVAPYAAVPTQADWLIVQL